MSIGLWGVGSLPKLNDPNVRVVTLATIFSTFSVCLFILTELVAVAGAAVWAITGIMHVSNMIAAGLAVLVGLPTVWVAIVVSILVFNAETDPENNRDLYPGIRRNENDGLATGG